MQMLDVEISQGHGISTGISNLCASIFQDSQDPYNCLKIGGKKLDDHQILMT